MIIPDRIVFVLLIQGRGIEFIMIYFFNRKLLATESDPQKVGDIKLQLKKSGIHYSIDVIRSRGGIGQSIDSSMAAEAGLRYNQFNTTSFIYKIYVRRKDYENARKVVYGK